jgi:hypothetical protein
VLIENMKDSINLILKSITEESNKQKDKKIVRY